MPICKMIPYRGTEQCCSAAVLSIAHVQLDSAVLLCTTGSAKQGGVATASVAVKGSGSSSVQNPGGMQACQCTPSKRPVS